MNNEAGPVNSATHSNINQALPQASPSYTKEFMASRQSPGDERRAGSLGRERASSVSDEYLRFLGKPGHVEKRFPVDRKKLERLIVAGRGSNETAEEFFQSVMRETQTLVLWPSKLKIGAKSKKDPQVKVVGLSGNVQQARELVLAELDAKSTRVTLKIDIPFSEHSHIIGKEGANIKKVHEETKCHIHFPDSNRSVHFEKSNQVSITGQINGVEMARQRIRELLPVVVTFNLPLPGYVDPNSPDIQQMMLQYSVNIHIKPQPQHYSLLVVVRGTVRYLDGMKLAISKIVEYFTGDYRTLPQISLKLDIATQHHRTIIGRDGGNIQKIMEDTATIIQFPDPQSRYHSNHVIVTGAMDDIFKAREQLLGCLPVVLMFDVNDSEDSGLGTDRQTALIGELTQNWDVYISIKAKQKHLVQSVIVKSIEQNMSCVYEARIRILEFSSQSIRSGSGFGTNRQRRNWTNDGTEAKLDHSSETENTSQTSLTASKPVLSDTVSKPVHSDTANTSVHQMLASCNEDVATITGQSSLADRPNATIHGLPGSGQSATTSLGSLQATGASVCVEEGGSEREMEIEREREREGREDRESLTSPSSPPVITMETAVTTTSMSPSLHLPPPRLTPRAFVDYDRKKEEAEKAKNSRVKSSEPRVPTACWAGYNLSESMPPQNEPTPSTQTKKPQGLSSLNKSGFQALMRQASIERIQNLQSEQEVYRGITDLPSLLRQLDMEKYQSCFDNEEIDLQIFLTMSESDLEGIGISTLGARRKLKIAISEMKKIQSSNKHPGGQANTPHLGGLGTSTGGRQMMSSYQQSLSRYGQLGKSSSLKRSGEYSMSQSVRF